MKISIILASTRQGRLGDKVAAWIYDLAKHKSAAQFELLDLRDYPLPLFNEPTPPMAMTVPYTQPLAKAWQEKIATSDGFIIVTPEYNYSFPAVLKNALDYLYLEWNNKPVGLVSYSMTTNAGIRSIQELLPVFSTLQLFSLRTTVSIPEVHKLIGENGKFDGEKIMNHANKFLDLIISWTQDFLEIRKKK